MVAVFDVDIAGCLCCWQRTFIESHVPRAKPCLTCVQEQDDAIRYLDDSKLQGRAIRVEKVPQPPPLQSLEIDPNHDFSSSHILPSSKATTPCFPDCITFPSQSPHPCSSATPNPEGQHPMSAACYGFTFTSHIPQPAHICSHIPRR